MNRPANPYKYAAAIINSAASVASGNHEYGLANQLWAFEKKLRDRGKELVEQHMARERGEEVPEETRTAIITARTYVSKTGDEPGHYEYADTEITFPAHWTLHYEPHQACLTVRRPSGEVAAVYQGIMQMVTPDVERKVLTIRVSLTP